MNDDGNPFSNGENGQDDYNRNTSGQSVPRTKPGPGSPRSRVARQLRALLNDVLVEVFPREELKLMLIGMREKAKLGDIQAAKLCLQLINPIAEALADRVEDLEAAQDEKGGL